MYLSSLDVSFARTGGCIVYLRKEHEKHVLKHIDASDILIDTYYYEKIRKGHESTLAVAERSPFLTWLNDKKNIKAACLYKIIAGR
jgi:hypothetical protein